MLPTRAFAALSATTALEPFEFNRRVVGDFDVLVEIDFCGVCHSDLHQARGEWGASTFPMVPGHEIIGRVARVGARVSRFAVGDSVGVGVFVDSCRTCLSCREGLEQYCETHVSLTYNSTEADRVTPTYGGYASQIVVDERYVLRIDERLDRSAAAPLLCAGITTYSPLRHWKVGKGSKVAVAGLGGLGHMGVKFARALGAEVTVISTSTAKEAAAQSLGAHDFLLSSDNQALERAQRRFDFILNTIAAPHDLNGLMGLLRRDGAMALVGLPPQPVAVHPFTLVPFRRQLAGSAIGGIAETQEMLDLCAERGIVADVEVIAIQEINRAFDRMLAGDVRYRFVIDMATL
jgi:uncharacterized zinc-type alcohol dehydrogenase-like protein